MGTPATMDSRVSCGAARGCIGEEDVGRCAAHVESDDAIEARPPRHLACAHHAARRAGEHGAHRLARCEAGGDDAARGLHHVHAAALWCAAMRSSS